MGKSTVLKLFKKHGAYIADSDRIVADIHKDQAVIKKLIKLLGDEVARKRGGKLILMKSIVSEIIFSDPKKRKAIEKVIHPEVLKEIKRITKKVYTKDKTTTREIINVSFFVIYLLNLKFLFVEEINYLLPKRCLNLGLFEWR